MTLASRKCDVTEFFLPSLWCISQAQALFELFNATRDEADLPLQAANAYQVTGFYRVFLDETHDYWVLPGLHGFAWLHLWVY